MYCILLHLSFHASHPYQLIDSTKTMLEWALVKVILCALVIPAILVMGVAKRVPHAKSIKEISARTVGTST